MAKREGSRRSAIDCLRAMAVAVCPLIACIAGVAYPAGVEASQTTGSADERSPLEILSDPSAPEADRSAAADALLARAESNDVRDALSRCIAGPLAPTSPGTVLVRAIARAPRVSPRLYPALAERMNKASPTERAMLVGALATFRTRDAARLILAQADPGMGDAALVSASFAALARLAGRTDLDDNRAAWTAWLRDAEEMGESQWRLSLAEAHAAKADELAGQVGELSMLLTNSIRDLFLATPADQRPKFLAGLLTDVHPAVRDIGFDLISRELSASGRVDGPVGAAAVQLLTHRSAEVRAKAAEIVRQIAPPDADAAVLAALADEKDTRVASELLLGIARWPTPSAIPLALRWLETPGPARAAAAEACWALYKAGTLRDEDAERALAVFRGMSDSEIPPHGVRILSSLGGRDDLRRVAGLLKSDNGPIRLAAAKGLTWEPGYADAIVAAAAADPSLMDDAARAVMVSNPTADGYTRVAQLAGPTPEVTRAALLRLAGVLPATDLLAVALRTSDPGLREDLLTNLAQTTRVMSEAIIPESADAIADGALRLADIRLARGDAVASLAGLDAVAGVAGANPEGFAFARCAALAALGRVEDAARTGAPIEAWFRGLEVSTKTEHAGALADAIERRFRNLTDEQKGRIKAARAALAAVPGDDSSKPK